MTPVDTALNPSSEALDVLLASGRPLLLYFSAPWSPQATLLARRLQEDMQPSGDVPLVVVDCDVVPHIADRFQVKSIPTLLAMLNHREQARLIGAFALGEVRGIIDALRRQADSERTF
jgi:thioredoxin-like negative regulator of GroEL